MIFMIKFPVPGEHIVTRADGEESPGFVRRDGPGRAHLLLLPRGPAAVGRARRPDVLDTRLPAQSDARLRLLPEQFAPQRVSHATRGRHVHAGVRPSCMIIQVAARKYSVEINEEGITAHAVARGKDYDPRANQCVLTM